jgi:hypothetical protein
MLIAEEAAALERSRGAGAARAAERVEDQHRTGIGRCGGDRPALRDRFRTAPAGQPQRLPPELLRIGRPRLRQWLYGTGMPKSRRLAGGRGTTLKPAYSQSHLTNLRRRTQRHAGGAASSPATAAAWRVEHGDSLDLLPDSGELTERDPARCADGEPVACERVCVVAFGGVGEDAHAAGRGQAVEDVPLAALAGGDEEQGEWVLEREGEFLVAVEFVAQAAVWLGAAVPFQPYVQLAGGEGEAGVTVWADEVVPASSCSKPTLLATGSRRLFRSRTIGRLDRPAISL